MKSNPKLEALRNSVLSPPDITPMYKRWLDTGDSILWSRCLGYRPGWRANRVICRLMDATNPGAGDWKDLAAELGIEYVDVKRIENTYGREGPSCRVLEEFVNLRDSTISELLKAIRRLGRDDILLAISPYMDVFQLHNSGYPPLPIEFEDSVEDNQSDSGVSSVRSVTIFSSGGPDSCQVESIPYQKSECIEEKTKCFTEKGCDTQVEKHADIFNEELKKSKELKDFKVVLLTFAGDGQEMAREVARKFRQQREGLPRLGVVILGENEEFLSVDPWGIIQRWFYEVDYIIPIITGEYLDRISSRFTRSVDMDSCLDARYVRLVYTLMCNEFTQRGCLNYRVRPLISSEILSMLDNVAMKNPLFMAWKKVDDCEKLAVNILKSPMRPTL